MPRRSRANCPSGKCGARVWAVCTAKAVLPRPGCPQSTATGGRTGSRSSASAWSRSSAGPRAVKSLSSRGRASAWCAVRSVAGADSGSVPGSSASPVVTGGSGPGWRRLPVAGRLRRPGAGMRPGLARCGAVVLRTVRVPCTTARTLTPAACASSFCVSPALLRKPRNSAPKSPVDPYPCSKAPRRQGPQDPRPRPQKYAASCFCGWKFLFSLVSFGLAEGRTNAGPDPPGRPAPPLLVPDGALTAAARWRSPASAYGCDAS